MSGEKGGDGMLVCRVCDIICYLFVLDLNRRFWYIGVYVMNYEGYC